MGRLALNPRFDFASDNTAGMAPEALEALITANQGTASGYGSDDLSRQAADAVRAFLDADAEVRFAASGTAANAVALAMLCRPFEAVLAHEHAHVTVDETGAPTFFSGGSGIIPLPGPSAKIDPKALADHLNGPDSPHHQAPAALSLTNSTEYGTVYSTAEARALIDLAKAKGVGVHLDGARLANAVASGFDPKAIAGLGVDVLVLGGTKAGMSPTEALVVFNKSLGHRLDARLKQAGQLPSKGRFYAAPWIGMLQSGAFVSRAAHANQMAQRLAALMPFKIVHPVQANGLFVEMSDEQHRALSAQGLAVYRVADGSVRFMCSWATTQEAVDGLGEMLRGAV
jgi:threonine aldolase